MKDSQEEELTIPERRIASFKYWELGLHECQTYLGRCVIWAKRDDDVDMMEMDKEEQEEFFEIGRALKKALVKCFSPDRINYANLQNCEHHLHFHVIPRYASERTIEETVFTDDQWGRNYAPYDKVHVSRSVMLAILEKLKSEF
eukprot:CAMPEP_0174250614 /NCGR_PEP_ID=MMETSP0439-20130205/741_1 /TAXON_ID=0 /ORGANISM="Stereomyxa ramosa, Strain Chinc5" /LENGTH=143 /DNA_ID=CAMNT_0015330741 /DNA_START=1 /DNA_END=432 /DNA_ORIENTATION=+